MYVFDIEDLPDDIMVTVCSYLTLQTGKYKEFEMTLPLPGLTSQEVDYTDEQTDEYYKINEYLLTSPLSHMTAFPVKLKVLFYFPNEF